MQCDKGFGNVETEYRKMSKLHDPQDFLAAASKVDKAEVRSCVQRTCWIIRN